MAEPPVHTPLHELADAMAAAGGPGVRLGALPPTTEVCLRADEPASIARLSELLGVELPRAPNTVALGDGVRALWTAPDEWLVVVPGRAAAELIGALEAAGGDELVTAVDHSANRVALELSGPHAADVLAHGCSLDLRDAAFPVGVCAQTLVGRVQVVLERTAPSAYVLRVRPSFATYLVAWLVDAMAEYAAGDGALSSSRRSS